MISKEAAGNLIRGANFTGDVMAWTSWCPPKQYMGHNITGVCLPATQHSLLQFRDVHSLRIDCKMESRGGIFQTFKVQPGSTYQVTFSATNRVDLMEASGPGSVFLEVQSPANSPLFTKAVALENFDPAQQARAPPLGPFNFVAKDTMARIFLYTGPTSCPSIDFVSVTLKETSPVDDTVTDADQALAQQASVSQEDLQNELRDRNEYIELLEQKNIELTATIRNAKKDLTLRDDRIREYNKMLTQANTKLQQFASQAAPHMELLFSNGPTSSKMTDQESFNRAVYAAARNHGVIVHRRCEDCASTHKDIYYRRFWGNWDPWLELLGNFHQRNRGKTFNLYSTFEDAILDTNEWTFCGIQIEGLGLPGTCAPTKQAARNEGQWNSLARKDGIHNYTFSVYWTPPELPPEDII